MNIEIAETGEKTKLDISNLGTGTNWISTADSSEGYYQMTQEDYEWWADFIDRHRKIRHRYLETLKSLDNAGYKKWCADVKDIYYNTDDCPEVLISIYSDFTV